MINILHNQKQHIFLLTSLTTSQQTKTSGRDDLIKLLPLSHIIFKSLFWLETVCRTESLMQHVTTAQMLDAFAVIEPIASKNSVQA